MTEIDKVKNGELAIENDSENKTVECVVHCFPGKLVPAGNARFYFKTDDEFGWTGWTSWQKTDLPTIKATQLWELINKENILK